MLVPSTYTELAMSGQAIPKPAKRRRDPDLLRNFAFRMSSCSACGEGRYSGLHAHHILLRSRSGDDHTANLCALCANCHQALHDGDAKVRRALGRHIAEKRPDVLAYLAEKLGTVEAEDFLRRAYDLPPAVGP
jgi:5-methylcytosine-specific restriction endonuclease McrA